MVTGKAGAAAWASAQPRDGGRPSRLCGFPAQSLSMTQKFTFILHYQQSFSDDKKASGHVLMGTSVHVSVSKYKENY